MQRRKMYQLESLIQQIRQKLWPQTHNRNRLTLRWESPIQTKDETIKDISIYWTSTDTILFRIINAQFPVIKTVMVSPRVRLDKLDYAFFKNESSSLQARYSTLFITGNNDSFTLSLTNGVPPEQSGYIQLDYYYVDRNCKIIRSNTCSWENTAISCHYSLCFRKGWNRVYLSVKEATPTHRVIEYSTQAPNEEVRFAWTAIPY